MVKGKAKEIHFSIAGDRIPTVKEEPVKSLGRWYEGNLSDKSKGMEIYKQAEDGLKAIDKTKLTGKYKVWCMQYGLYPRLQWPLMMYEVGASRVEKIEQKCSVYIRKWLRLPKHLNNTAIYGKKQQLALPIPSIFEEFKAGKVRTVLMLRYSKDNEIRDDPPEVRTYRKWNAEKEVDHAISSLKHQDVVGATQTGRGGFGTTSFKPFGMCKEKEKRDAVIREVRRTEQGKRHLHLVQCSQQGQCLGWEDRVIERKLKWNEIWEWEPARLSFLLKATYDMLPTPANLVRWKISEDDKCKCGKKGTLRHILSACPMGLNERYTWRHNQVLRVFSKYLEEQMKDINEGKIPSTEVRKKVRFHKEGQRGNSAAPSKNTKKDERWSGSWNVAADLDTQVVFPVVTTTQRPDLVVWNAEKKHALIMELTVPWEDNFEQAEERKEERYADLIDACKDKGWETEYYHLAVGCRGYVDRKIATLYRNRFGLQSNKVKRLIKDLQEAAEKSSLFVWLKRDDTSWAEV